MTFRNYQEKLVTMRDALELALKNREAITIEKSPDTLDEIQFAAIREIAILNLDRESQRLHSIRAALLRIDNGSYGICLICEETINPKRLNAVPWAALCICCQEKADKRNINNGDLVTDAA